MSKKYYTLQKLKRRFFMEGNGGIFFITLNSLPYNFFRKSSFYILVNKMKLHNKTSNKSNLNFLKGELIYPQEVIKDI